VASYEATCAGCHDEKIATSVAGGIPMIELPMLDVDALRSAGHDVGAWPEKASGDFDGRLPPVMKLLLASDPAAAKAMNTLGDDFELIDVDPDDPQHLAACAALATAIKQLLAELAESGPAIVRSRLDTVLGREVLEREASALVAGLSVDTLRGAAAAWVPNVGQDPKTAATEMRPKTEPRSRNPEPSYAPSGHWFRDDTTFSIRYQPVAHADPVLTSWLDTLAKAPDITRQPLALAAFKELSNPTAAGLCVSCHSVEQTAAGPLAINWRAFDRTTAARSFTKFSHGPHLALPQLAECSHCHAIDARADSATSNIGWNPSQFASEFLPISKHKCAACHTATAAGDRCQSCHNYHIDLQLPTQRGLNILVQ
jgi:hypothetical protein